MTKFREGGLFALVHNIQDYGCNRRKKNESLRQNKCFLPNIIYEATVTNNNDVVEKYFLNSTKGPLRKGTVTILNFSGYKVIVKIQIIKIYMGIKNENKIPFIKW